MSIFRIRNTRFAPDQRHFIAEGGEAEIYELSSNLCVKLFKSPTHPQFAGEEEFAKTLREAARVRLEELQEKLPAFPTSMPPLVITPQDFVVDDDGRIHGYTMQFLKGASCLFELKDRSFKDRNKLDDKEIIRIFLELHDTIASAHSKNVVVGDLNPFNILLFEGKPYVIDSESMQYGGFACRTFTSRYTDPRLCESKGQGWQMIAPHHEEGDWYSFSMMLFESLLGIHPYGGVHVPKKGEPKVGIDERPLHRLSVFSNDVRYPKTARPLEALPVEFRDYFENLLQNDSRITFPRNLLSNMECHHGGRLSLPVRKLGFGRKAITSSIFQLPETDESRIHTVLGSRKQTRFIYSQNGLVMREGGIAFMQGEPSATMQFYPLGDDTVVCENARAIRIDSKGTMTRIPAEPTIDGRIEVATNEASCYFYGDGYLCRTRGTGYELLFETVSRYSKLWLGEHWGVSLANAGRLKLATLFDLESHSRKRLDLSSITGRLIDHRCLFGIRTLWILATTSNAHRLVNHCLAFDYQGTEVARESCTLGDDTWLGDLERICVYPDSFPGHGADALLALTENASYKVDNRGERIDSLTLLELNEILESPDDRITVSEDSLISWNPKEIKRLNDQHKVRMAS